MTMTNTIAIKSRGGLSAARIVTAVSSFLRAWKNRRAFYRLGEMTDCELADIGLCRSDIQVVSGLPMGSDPTTHLGELAEARRQNAGSASRF